MATAIGIHVSGTTARRAELRQAGDRIQVVRLDRLTLAAASESPPAAASPAPGTPATGGRRNGHGQAGDHATAVACAPAPDVMTRWWSLPDVDDVKLRQVVAHRLEADLPLPMDRLTWSCRKLPGVAADRQGRWVLAQAAPRDRVARHLAALQTAGFAIDAVTTEAEAIGALCRHGLAISHDDGTVAVVFATPEEWLITVITNGYARAVRRLRPGADATQSACRGCRQAIEAEVSLHNVRRVYWCAAEDMNAARDSLAAALGMPVDPVGAADRLIGENGERLTVGQLTAFGPSLGLALAGLLERNDMIRLADREEPAASAAAQRLRPLLEHPKRWAAAAFVLLVLAGTIHIGAIAWESRQMRALLAARGTDQSTTAELQEKVRILQRLERYRIDVEAVMADLCRAAPDSIVLSSIQLVRGQRIVIKGTCGDPKAVFRFADDLRKSSRFASVNPERTEPGQGGGFTLSAELTGVQKFSSAFGRGGP